jgi:hypothetical protein
MQITTATGVFAPNVPRRIHVSVLGARVTTNARRASATILEGAIILVRRK